MKNLSRRLWGYFVPFITSKWEVCVHINLNLIFVWDAAPYSARPCSQSNARHCQLWPCSAQLRAAGQNLPVVWQCSGSSGESPSPLSFQLCSCLVPYSCSARWICWGSVAGVASSASAERSVHTQHPWLQTLHLLGLRGVEKLCWRPCHSQVFPKIWASGFNPTEITVPQARKNVY